MRAKSAVIVAVIALIVLMAKVSFSEDDSSVQIIKVSAWSYGYTIHLKKNEKIKAGKILFIVTNTSPPDMIHDAKISRVKKSKEYNPYRLDSIIYTTPYMAGQSTKKLEMELSHGKYVIWCSVGRHLMEGMYLYFEVVKQ